MTRALLRWGAWIIAIACVAGGVWLVLRPKAVPCDVVQIGRGDLVVRVEEDGRTRLKERYVVFAPLGGVVERIGLKPGDDVRANETILTRIAPSDPSLLDDRSRAQAEAQIRVSEAAMSRAEAELARLQGELEHVGAEFERARKAAESSALSVRELEDERILLRSAENAASAGRFAHAMAQYELEQARAALLQQSDDAAARRTLEMRSPITGKVLRVIRENAGAVTPGDALIELGSLSELEVAVDVLSDQAVRVRPGQLVSIERWGGGAPLEGVVRVVEPSGFTKVSALGVEEQRVNVVIDFLAAPAERAALGDQFRVEARITVLAKQDVLRVPVGCLVQRGGVWSVYVVEDGVARLRAIELGERSAEHAEVPEGLTGGEAVDIFPSDRIADGDAVAPRESRSR